MQDDHSIFRSEWWWPKWSDLSALPIPPEPRQQDYAVARAFADDLELGVAKPLEPKERGKPDCEDTQSSDPLLRTYPDRSLRTSESWAKW